MPACREACKLGILQGLPLLSHVVAAGYGEYCTEGLPPSVQCLDIAVSSQRAGWGMGWGWVGGQAPPAIVGVCGAFSHALGSPVASYSR